MIRVGIVGSGIKTPKLIQTLKALEVYDVKGVYCHKNDDAVALSLAHKINMFPSPNALLAEVDAIFISDSGEFYHFVANHAIKKSKHIYVDSPVHFDFDDVKQLIKLANEASIKFHIERKERFNPAFQAAKSVISNANIISIARDIPIDADCVARSLVLHTMIHDVEIVLDAVKSRLRKISVSGISMPFSISHVINARLEFDNGSVATIINNRIAKLTSLKANFYQDDVAVNVDFIENEICINRLQNATVKSLNRKGGNIVPLKQELLSFYYSISEKTYNFLTNEDEALALEIATKIFSQVEKKGIVI